MDERSVPDKPANGQQGANCFMASSIQSASYAIFVGSLLTLLLASRVLHLVLRRVHQPMLVSEFIVGLASGNWGFIKGMMDAHVPLALQSLAEVTIPLYLFAVGIEMDARALFRRPGRDAVVAYAGIACTLVSTMVLNPLLDRGRLGISEGHSSTVAFVLSVVFANTSSPVLTRLTTDLKIGKSDIGRLVVAAGIHNDMVTTMFLCLFATVRLAREAGSESQVEVHIAWVLFGLAVMLTFISKVMPVYMGWVDDRNPEGKRMKGFDLTLSFLVVAGLWGLGRLFYLSNRSSAFLVGLLLPREGRVANQLITKLNLYLSTVGIPFYLCWVGFSTDTGAWNGVTVDADMQVTHWSWGTSLAKLVLIFTVSTVGKVVGSLLACMYYGFRAPEAIAVGLLLNVKGTFHIFGTYGAKMAGMINDNTLLVMLLVIIATIVYIPLVVAIIVARSRRRAHRRLMCLQWHNPEAELRVVVGIHGTHNVPAVLSLVEATRGGRSQGPLAVFAMDLVEMTDRVAASLAHGHGGVDAVTVTDDAVVEAHNAITHTLEAYAGEAGGGLTVRRLLTASAFSDMHLDICNGADDIMASLIVLPFHRRQRPDGGMDAGHPGFRQVNEKVLQHAPCSVGILVDRGLAGSNLSSASYANKHVAVVFIGGSDDREALIYAGRMALHPGVHLTVVRFLHEGDPAAGAAGGRVLEAISSQEREMQQDDECFADFYERHIASGGVGYVEKYVANGAETVATLRTLEGHYNLFVVGRGGRRHSALTAGMSDWAECPELGPIGDILAASDFSLAASVLIIQQHSAAKMDAGDPADEVDPDFAVI